MLSAIRVVANYWVAVGLKLESELDLEVKPDFVSLIASQELK